MGLKLPKLRREFVLMGLKPMENSPKPLPNPVLSTPYRPGTNPPSGGGNVKPDQPTGVISWPEKLSESDYQSIREALIQVYQEAQNPCAEVCCTQLAMQAMNTYYPFCSWDCKDWDEQIKRR